MDQTGQGPGATTTALTLQGANGNVTTEAGGVTVAGVPTGDAKTGASQFEVFTFGQLGITSASQFRIILNLNENPNEPTASVNTLSLNAFTSAGASLGSFSLGDPVTVTQVANGLGGSGLVFKLDAGGSHLTGDSG